MSVLLEFAMFPTDHGEGKSAYVSRILEMIDGSGHPYVLTPMGTVVEFETVEEALKLVGDAYKQLEPDCNRVYSTLKLDIRKGTVDRLEGKIASVEATLGRKLSSSSKA